VQNDSNMVVYVAGGPTSSRTMDSELTATLLANQQIISADGSVRVITQGDGNLVEYQGGTALWAAGHQGAGD
jgi:hypothetical protein